MDEMTTTPESPKDLTEEEILARFERNPELLERFKAGDLSALAELLEVGLDTEVIRTSVRLLA